MVGNRGSESAAGRGIAAPSNPTRSSAKVWNEDVVDPPVDLRLVPLALALWIGCGTALLGGESAARGWLRVLGGCLLVVGVVLAGFAWSVNRRGRPTDTPQETVSTGPATVPVIRGCLVAVVGLLAGMTVAAAAVLSAAGHPLMAAADQGKYVELTLTVAGAPMALPQRFAGDEGNSGTDQATPQQFRVEGVSVASTIGSSVWSGELTVSMVGSGPGWAELVPGQQVLVRGTVTRDDFPVVPGVRLRASGVPEVVSQAPWWQRAAAAIRADLATRAHALGGDPAGLLPGLVVGDTSGIDERLSADAKATGLTHLLAVSGSHFVIVCGAVVLILRRLGPKVAATGGALVLVALVVLVGPQPSVLRAAVMGAVTVVALYSGRTRTAVPALAAAVISLLLIDPAMALRPGFAMSVLATAGLVLMAPPWSQALRRRGIPRGWAELLVIPVAASIMTLPIVVALSGMVPLATIPANLLAAAVVPPALIIGLLCAISGPICPPLADLLAQIDRPLLGWIAQVAHSLAGLPHATAGWPAGLPWVLVLTGLMAISLVLLRRRRIRALVGALALGVGVVLVPVQVLPPVGWPPQNWVAVGCEVGQGDAFVLSTDEPDAAIVIDAGPDPDLVDRCLDALGIGTVPLVVLTHLHADHIDGLAGVLSGRSVGMIGVGPSREPAGAWQTVLDTAARSDVPVVSLPVGGSYRAAGTNVTVLGPRRPFVGTESDANNESVVLMAEHAGVRLLFTGDIEQPAQRALLSSGVDLRADVLKVPHHGSAKDLPEFVSAVSPSVALIGVGQDNDYGHPSPSVLNMLQRNGITIRRTDQDGDIAVSVLDGKLATVVRGSLIRT